MLRIDGARRYDARDLGNGLFRRHGHQRIEIQRSHPVGEIAQGIAELSLDQGEIGLQPALLHIVPPVEFGDGLTLCEFCAVARRRVERGDARTAGANTFRERALRYDFQLDLSGEVQIREHFRVSGPGKRTDKPGDLSLLDQRGKPDMAIAGIVVDDGQVPRPRVNQRVDQFDRRARAAEPADHHCRAIADIGHGRCRRNNCFVHRGFLPRIMLSCLPLASSGMQWRLFTY